MVLQFQAGQLCQQSFKCRLICLAIVEFHICQALCAFSHPQMRRQEGCHSINYGSVGKEKKKEYILGRITCLLGQASIQMMTLRNEKKSLDDIGFRVKV